MNIKKSIAILGIATLALTMVSSTALAKDDGNQNHGIAWGKFFSGIFKKFEHKLPDTSFVVTGTVVSTGTNSVVVNVKTSANVANITNSQVTITTDANTKIVGKGHDEENKSTLTLADIKAGDQIEVNGNVSGTTLTAVMIRDMGPVPPTPAATSGKVTAVSATSLTLTNAISGKSQAFTLDSNTKVNIDGASKTVADIAVGDAGTVKAKSDTTGFTAQAVTLFR